MLELKNVCMTFHAGTPDENRALKNINLKINQGDFITVIGSNGAGKSTLMNVIAGTYKASSGEIFYEERNVTKEPEYKRARYIGRIFQNPLLGTAGKMSLEDNMVICSKKGSKSLKISLNNKLRAAFREQLKALDMNLENRLNDNVELLSGGQRQALTLLMAVMSKPALLLLDEHTAALDPKTAKKVLELTEFFVQRDKLTTFMVTHNMRDAIRYGNRLIMMLDGHIVYEVGGEEKKKLEVKDLLERFSVHQGEDTLSDKMLLS